MPNSINNSNDLNSPVTEYLQHEITSPAPTLIRELQSPTLSHISTLPALIPTSSMDTSMSSNLSQLPSYFELNDSIFGEDVSSEFTYYSSTMSSPVSATPTLPFDEELVQQYANYRSCRLNLLAPMDELEAPKFSTAAP